jgi:hypothetical protein
MWERPPGREKHKLKDFLSTNYANLTNFKKANVDLFAPAVVNYGATSRKNLHIELSL